MIHAVVDGRLCLTKTEFCAQLKLPRKRVYDMLDAGDLDEALVKVPGKKLPHLDVGKAVKIIYSGDEHALRVRKLREEGDKLALENERTRAEWLPRAEVEAAWADAAIRSRNNALLLPDRVCAELSVMTDAVKIKALLVEEIDKNLEDECSEIDRLLMEDDDAAG